MRVRRGGVSEAPGPGRVPKPAPPADPALSGPAARGRIQIRRDAFDGAHLAKDLLHLALGDDVLVRTQAGVALVADRLLQIRQDLRAIRVRAQFRLRAVEVASQLVVRAFFELVGGAVEIDRGDLAHAHRPSWVMVELRLVQ